MNEFPNFCSISSHFVKCEFLLNAISNGFTKLSRLYLPAHSLLDAYMLSVQYKLHTAHIIMQYFNQLIFAQLFSEISHSDCLSLSLSLSVLVACFIPFGNGVFGFECYLHFLLIIIVWDCTPQFQSQDCRQASMDLIRLCTHCCIATKSEMNDTFTMQRVREDNLVMPCIWHYRPINQ